MAVSELKIKTSAFTITKGFFWGRWWYVYREDDCRESQLLALVDWTRDDAPHLNPALFEVLRERHLT